MPSCPELLRTLLERPDDDAPRLVYADWLDENGEPDRAEFIRVQIYKGDLSYSWQYKVDKHGWRNHLGCKWVADLCLRHEQRTGSWPGYSWGSSPSPTGPGLYKSGAEEVWMKYQGCVETTFRRGFVDEVALPWLTFLGGNCPECRGHGRHADHSEAECTACGGKTGTGKCGTGKVVGLAATIFAAHPVTRVRLTDAVIHPSGGNDTYYVGNLGVFPKEYWRRLEGLRSRSDALGALAAVCLEHGRKLADLPIYQNP
jgi:uncharacterized protein (TIGR02996 family)